MNVVPIIKYSSRVRESCVSATPEFFFSFLNYWMCTAKNNFIRVRLDISAMIIGDNLIYNKTTLTGIIISFFIFELLSTCIAQIIDSSKFWNFYIYFKSSTTDSIK